MKTILAMAALALTGLTAQGQNTETRNVNGFNGIEVQNGIELVLTQGNAEKVVVESSTKGNLHYVITKMKGSTLHIYFDEKGDANQLNKGSIKVYVTDNDLNSLKAESGAMVRVTNELDVPQLRIDLRTGANFTGSINTTELCEIDAESGAGFKGSIVTGKLKADIIGGAYAKLLGHADKATVFCSGGTLVAGSFTADKADITAKRLSSVNMNVKDSVFAETDNSSAITYTGSPEKVKLGETTFAVSRN